MTATEIPAFCQQGTGLPESAATYSPARSTAVHEAWHAVMAYLLRRRFMSISVVEDEDSAGRVISAATGDWFRPDIEIDGRTRRLVEDRIMILLAGGESERAWCERITGAPDDWQEMVSRGESRDLQAAVNLADYVAGGSTPELEAFLEWMRQRVLGFTAHGPDYEVDEGEHPFVVTRQRFGDERILGTRPRPGR